MNCRQYYCKQSEDRPVPPEKTKSPGFERATAVRKHRWAPPGRDLGPTLALTAHGAQKVAKIKISTQRKMLRISMRPPFGGIAGEKFRGATPTME